MFSRELEIKKSSGAFIAKGLFYLFMLLLSVFCCLSRWVFIIDEQYITYITAVGFASTLYFGYLFSYTIYRGIHPKNALILTEKGIYDFINEPSKGIFINWENISSVKMFGSDKAPLLGIELYDSDILIESLRKNIAEEIRSNIQTGLPAIVIRQSDIAPSLQQILPAFNEFISLTRPIPTVNSAPTAKKTQTDKNTQTAKDIPYVMNAPMSQKITDETTDDSIMVVADELPIAEPVNPSSDKDDDIYIVPPEPIVIVPDEIVKNEDVSALAFSDTTSKQSEKPSFDNFKFDSEPIFTDTKSEESNEINFTRTKEMPAVKPSAEPAPTKAADTAKEEPQQLAQKKEIKTLEELLAQFSVPTNKDKK